MASAAMMPAWLPIVEKSVFRFDESESARKEAAPSVSFVNPRLREDEIDTTSFDSNEPEFIPVFEADGVHQVVTLKLPAETSFYGTGEVGGSAERTGKRIYAWNTDAWGYNQNTTSLYQSHPWVFSILPSGQAFGVLADTTRRCEIDLRKESTIRIVATAPFPVITFGPFPTPEALMTSLAHAIGTMQMPPKWALGYQQGRWSYETAARVSEVATTFREKKLPCDVVWMDIDYMQNFKCFTFDKDAFPDPNGLSGELHSKGFKGIWMLDPGIHAEKGYEAYDTGSEEDVWIQTADGKPYIGECWPGPVVFPDFLNKKTRAWWAKLVKEFVAIGVDGIWNDMNEPAVLKTVTKTMPETNLHRGDEEYGGRQSHSHYHNVYGMFQARSTYEGMVLANGNKRPFVLTRAAFLGAHRYAATWTGDNFANWEHLSMSIPMALNLGLSGQSFSGPVIGGFSRDSNPKLFARWMGLGAMLPFARGHSEKETIDHEPWSFGPEVEDLSRFALNRRYRMLPHFYTLFYKSHTTGVPVMTPVFFADPTDVKLRKIDDSFLLGPILVKTWPSPKKRNTNADIILPKGIWQRFHFSDDHPELPLLFLKGGAIVPTGPVIQHVGEASPTDTVTLLVALDDKGRASGDLYEDVGDGFGFQTGDYLLTHYEAEKVSSSRAKDGEVVIRVASAEGHLARPKRTLHVRLLMGENTQVEGECVDGEELRIQLPAEEDISKFIVLNRENEFSNLERLQSLLDEVFEDHHPIMGVGAVLMPEDLENKNVFLKVVPWLGGHIMSMIHKPSGYEWMEGRLENGGYEEFSGSEFRSSGWNEFYKIVKREQAQAGGVEVLGLEGDIGGGLILAREFLLPRDSLKTIRISSSIVARSVGAGSGGFSRLVRLRIHPMFKIVHPMESYIEYTAIDGKRHELKPDMEFGEFSIEGSDRPNGEWRLLDSETGLAVVNRFDIKEVALCHVKWGPGSVTLELWSEERPVSKDTPLSITHEYDLINTQMKGECIDGEELRIQHHESRPTGVRLWRAVVNKWLSSWTEVIVWRILAIFIAPGEVIVSPELREMCDREFRPIKVSIIETPMESSVGFLARLFKNRRGLIAVHSHIRVDVAPDEWIKAEKVHRGAGDAGIRITRETKPAEDTDETRLEVTISRRPGIIKEVVDILKDQDPNYNALADNCWKYVYSAYQAILEWSIKNAVSQNVRDELEQKLAELEVLRRPMPLDVARLGSDVEAGELVLQRLDHSQQGLSERSSRRAILEGVERGVRRSLHSVSSPSSSSRTGSSSQTPSSSS